MKCVAPALLAACAIAATPAAMAHHSGNMFEPQKETVLDGTIKEFQWTNPHTWIQLSVPTAQGGTEEWSIEGGSPNLVARQGWKRNSFKTGDKVTLRVHPMRNGQPAGLFISATFADGHTLGVPPGTSTPTGSPTPAGSQTP